MTFLASCPARTGDLFCQTDVMCMYLPWKRGSYFHHFCFRLFFIFYFQSLHVPQVCSDLKICFDFSSPTKLNSSELCFKGQYKAWPSDVVDSVRLFLVSKMALTFPITFISFGGCWLWSLIETTVLLFSQLYSINSKRAVQGGILSVYKWWRFCQYVLLIWGQIGRLHNYSTSEICSTSGLHCLGCSVVMHRLRRCIWVC